MRWQKTSGPSWWRWSVASKDTSQKQLLYQEHSSGNRIEPIPFEKLEQIVPRNVTKKAVPDRSKISMQNDYEVKYWTRTLWRHSEALTARNRKSRQLRNERS
jgi:Protein of unknown function (DUF3606)